ncbi:endothelial lipase-like [Penaeus monodon]|uniref:endothelial lipase-like n=1 Tax=Penaeus monodon TaxID=6687 RepID=UPI0018A6FB53|nr:endothelial lipase-like [Penaeus monodon]
MAKEYKVNPSCALAVLALGYAIILGPLLLYYIPTGRNGVFYYFCNSTDGDRNPFIPTAEGLSVVPISSSSDVTLIIHGFSESSHRPWIHRLTKALIARGEGNHVVLVVDYWDLHSLNYLVMRQNARIVADLIASLIDGLVRENDHSLARTHVVGFSMGGRISGMVGQRLKTGTLGRITALDPSFPFLHPVDNAEQLDSSDADLVVILRTSVVSYFNPKGHVDFSPNGGIVQPGCDIWFYPSPVQQGCSHFRAVTLALEATQMGGQGVFPSCGCQDWESFVNTSCPCSDTSNFYLTPYAGPSGHFFLHTNSDPPYTLPLRP